MKARLAWLLFYARVLDMATVTIPKKITRGEELVVITRKEYDRAFGVARRGEATALALLKKQLRLGAIARASRDRAVAKEWFPLDESIWRKGEMRTR